MGYRAAYGSTIGAASSYPWDGIPALNMNTLFPRILPSQPISGLDTFVEFLLNGSLVGMGGDKT